MTEGKFSTVLVSGLPKNIFAVYMEKERTMCINRRLREPEIKRFARIVPINPGHSGVYFPAMTKIMSKHGKNRIIS